MAIYDYSHKPFHDFTKPENIEAYKAGLARVESYLGDTYGLIIDGKRIQTGKTYVSKNPANHQEVIGSIYRATKKEADMAMDAALRAFETWKHTPAQVRADVLLKTAAILRRRHFEFSALMTKEAGKPFAEADADCAEAIDFLEYYARQMVEIDTSSDRVLSRKNIERNEYRYIPLGVAAVITPWNFPLAILAGMTSAAVVTGNTVLLKPADTTQVIAYKFIEAMEEAGLPEGVVNFIPGEPDTIGDYIVKHPKTRLISFTGSMHVGKTIYENAAKVQEGQIWLKRVIAEMGGKDAIIVDDSADLDAAAQGIVQSAFAFAGQKCSACSRAIIHESVYETMVEKIKHYTASLQVGNPADSPNVVTGPVTDLKAFNKIAKYIDVGKQEGKLLIGGNVDDSTGFFIDPTVFIDVDPSARIMQEEIFGPVLAVTKAKDFDDALDIANDTMFGLTGAVYSKNREHLELAREAFHVGNLYFNRKCTGAIVGYQPFGGFNMSGTDAKAGGPDYLLLHMQGKTITEAL